MSSIYRHHHKVLQAVLVFVLLSGGLFTAIFLVDIPTPGKQASAKGSEKLTVISGDYRQEIVSEYDQRKTLEKLNKIDSETLQKLDKDLDAKDIKKLITTLDQMESNGEITRQERILIEEEISLQIR